MSWYELLEALYGPDACEFCGDHTPPIRICADCGRWYCQHCAAVGEGETVEECCELCQLYTHHRITSDGHNLTFSGKIVGTSIEIHSRPHKYQASLLAMVRRLARVVLTEIAATESLDEGESGRRPVG